MHLVPVLVSVIAVLVLRMGRCGLGVAWPPGNGTRSAAGPYQDLHDRQEHTTSTSDQRAATARHRCPTAGRPGGAETP